MALLSGSSPLARGLPPKAGASAPARRIIPARAGFTHVAPSVVRGGGDHLRSRGVYTGRSPPPGANRGSSPLARGLRPHQGAHRNYPRIIPARAGFTATENTRTPVTPDHPRSRGVYPRGRTGAVRPAGSSPLARGLRRGRGRPSGRARIIPARAGFTTFRMTIPPGKEDHPRSRGVYRAGPKTASGSPGSSPLARGLRHAITLDTPAAGIIPARAGFT
mgnify:CR=1 FL=1